MEGAFEIARTLVELVPDDAASWLKQAESLRKMKGAGPRQAWDALIPVADKFPKTRSWRTRWRVMRVNPGA